MQLFSIAHGGRVGKNPKGKEVGLFEIHPSRQGKSDPVVGALGSFRTLEWHGDVVTELPEGAVHLAYSDKTRNQVAVLDGIHYLVQADAQAATTQMVRSWLKHDGKWATDGQGVTATRLIRDVERSEAGLRNSFLRMFGNFLSLAL